MSIPEAKGKETINEDEIEIRLSDIVQFLKDSRLLMIVGTVIGLTIGALYAYSEPNVYSAHVKVLPEMQAKSAGMGGLGSLAVLAGIDIGNSTGGSMDAIRPDIYPDVLQSVPFALHLLQQPVYSQLLLKETSLDGFLEEQDKESLVGGLMHSEENKSGEGMLDPANRSKTLQITKRQEDLVRQVHNAVAATFDKKTGIITVDATLPDPVVAAGVARLSLEYLTNYITSYRTEKARNQVRFLTGRVTEAKNSYQMSEYALSSYRDRNRSVFLNTAKIEEQRLQADFMLTQSVLNDLSKQLEQAKIKVAEESPVFKILEPAQVPLKKSGPKRSLIVIGFAIAGSLFGIFVYGVRKFFNSVN